jgi:hypothetical protein
MRCMPHAIATERGSLLIARPSETPEGAPIPFKVLADCPKQVRSGVGKAIGSG